MFREKKEENYLTLIVLGCKIGMGGHLSESTYKGDRWGRKYPAGFWCLCVQQRKTWIRMKKIIKGGGKSHVWPKRHSCEEF